VKAEVTFRLGHHSLTEKGEAEMKDKNDADDSETTRADANQANQNDSPVPTEAYSYEIHDC
jgi:hypothetical protein